MSLPDGPALSPAQDLHAAAPGFLHAPEASRSIFLVTFAAACVPLSAGAFFFGWRAVMLAGVGVAAAMLAETSFYRLTRTPSLLGRSHAALTGLLLALTLPPTSPWYVAAVGALFAVVLGKCLFGGVGHFLWQPALVGRLAVTVLFAPPLAPPLEGPLWPVLTPDRVLVGDVTQAQPNPHPQMPWRRLAAPPDGDALASPPPVERLRQLTLPTDQPPESIVSVLTRLPPMGDLVLGACPGRVGETSAAMILVAGLYLVYRNYVRQHLPVMLLAAAAATAAIAPIRDAAGAWQWFPVVSQGADVGLSYVAAHLATGELMLAAWFMATEMTSRPVTAPAQAIFGLLCGVLAMVLRLYTTIPIPAYAAVLACNTLTPVLDGIQPHPLGVRRWWQRRR